MRNIIDLRRPLGCVLEDIRLGAMSHKDIQVQRW